MITPAILIQLLHAGASVDLADIDTATLIESVKQSHQTVIEAKAELAKIQKELDNQKTYYKNADDERTELKKEINQLHTVFDSLDGCPPKDIENADYYNNKRSLMTRLFVYLAQRKA